MINLLPIVSAEAGIGTEHYQTVIRSENHELFADEPATLMGTDTGMSPYSLLLASLGSCTAITLRMYADRKAWPVAGILVKLNLFRDGNITTIKRELSFKGDLTPEQHNRLLAIANQCPVHQMLTGTIHIDTNLSQ